VTKKSDLTLELLEKIQPQWPLPEPLPEATLIEQGMYAILLRRLEPKDAKEVVARLRKIYSDWNELRVAQAQEIATHLDLGAKGVPAAHEIREYLQEVFQRSHGMELEFLRTDAQSTQRFLSILPYIGMATSHYLLWLAGDRELPVTPALMRVLDRIGLVSRTASPKKARAVIEPIVPKGQELEFAYKFGEIATRWCDARKPLCHLCVLVDDCKYGKKAFRDWKVQQERLQVQRAREAARLAILQKKEENRRRREEERERKKQALEAAKRAKEAERAAKVAAKKKAIADAKAAKQRAILEAREKRAQEAERKQREAEAKRAAAKAAIEKKKLEAKKAAEKKKADALKAKKKAAELKARLAAKKKAAAKSKKAGARRKKA
jgi:endonuclease III